MKVKIVGTGSAVPEKCVTNDDLSQWMDTSDEWIRSRTGIETRHLAVRETTTEMAVEAAKRALASAHMDAEELDLIIAATALEHGLTVVTRDVDEFVRAGVRVKNPWER